MVVNSETTVRKLVSLPRPMLRAVEDFRFDNRINTESEAIRRLLELGLKAAGEEVVQASKPSPKRARSLPDQANSYAPAQFYSAAPVPSGGFSWESVSPESEGALGTKVPKRLTEKLNWLSRQFQAAGHKVTQQKIVVDVLGGFARRELQRWGVPPDQIE